MMRFPIWWATRCKLDLLRNAHIAAPMFRRGHYFHADTRELADDEWISWSTGQICHDWLVHTLRADGAQPRVRHAASEHSTQLALVAAGLGAAVIPRLGREPAPASVRLVPIDPSPIRRIYALWRASTALRPAIGTTLDALQRSCPART